MKQISDRFTEIKQAGRIVLSVMFLLAFVGLTAACRPMYGSTSLGHSTSSRLAAVEIAPMNDRVGQRVRNELIFLFTGGGQAAIPNYKLDIIVRQSEQGVLHKRTDDASGMVYSIDADYTLHDASGKSKLTSGHSHARAAYDRHSSTFANIRAKKDAEDRAARDIARDINNRLAAYMSTNE